MLSENEPASEIGSWPSTLRAAASTRANAPSADDWAISASPFAVCMAKVSISASKTSKSSLDIEVLATTGLVNANNIIKTRKTADFLGSEA